MKYEGKTCIFDFAFEAMLPTQIGIPPNVGIKRPGREANHLCLLLRLRMELYVCSA
jgi:hypothetical protein